MIAGVPRETKDSGKYAISDLNIESAQRHAPGCLHTVRKVGHFAEPKHLQMMRLESRRRGKWERRWREERTRDVESVKAATRGEYGKEVVCC